MMRRRPRKTRWDVARMEGSEQVWRSKDLPTPLEQARQYRRLSSGMGRIAERMR